MHPVTVVLLIFYAIINLFTAKCWSAREMKQDFIEGQCLVGRIFANIFYAPAWFLKGLRVLVLATIK